MRDARLDGYSHFKGSNYINPIVYQDKVFTFYEINTIEGLIVGVYLDCQDLATGKILSRKRYGRTDGERIDIPIRALIKDNKLLVLGKICRVLNDTIQSFGATLRNMTLSTREYNVDDGTLMTFKHGDFEDHSGISMEVGAEKFYKSYMFEENGNIRYLERSKTNTNVFLLNWINSYLIDRDGRILSKDSILNYQISFNVIQIHPDTILMTEIDTAGILFRYLSPDLKEYYSLKIKNEFDHIPVQMEIKDYSKENRQNLFFNQRNSPFPGTYFESYVYTFDGEFVAECDFPNSFRENFYPIDWVSNPEEYLGVILRTNETGGLDNFLTSKRIQNQNEETILKKMRPTDSLRIATPIWSKKVDDGNVLISLFEDALYIDTLTHKPTYDWDSGANSYMLVKGESLGLFTGTSDQSVTASINIFPNPAHVLVYIRAQDEPIQSIEVVDISGRIIDQFSVTDYQKDIDVSHYASGIYILKIRTNHRSITKKIVVE